MDAAPTAPHRARERGGDPASGRLMSRAGRLDPRRSRSSIDLTSAVIAKLLVRRRTVWYLAAHESSCRIAADRRAACHIGALGARRHHPAAVGLSPSHRLVGRAWDAKYARRAAARYEPGYRPLVAAAMRGGWSRRVAARCAGTRSETADDRRSRTTGRRGTAAPGAATRDAVAFAVDGRHPGPGPASIHRIWVAHGLQPHRVRTCTLSTDPAFVEQLTDVVGLYVNPPDKALVVCVDEKSQIHALQRSQPGRPLKPGRAGTMPHDDQRHGTTTLFAALVLDGTVIGSCHARHRQQESELSQRARRRHARRHRRACHRRQLRHAYAFVRSSTPAVSTLTPGPIVEDTVTDLSTALLPAHRRRAAWPGSRCRPGRGHSPSDSPWETTSCRRARG